MARINIEECWWSDPRRSKLIRLLQGDTRAADGLAIEAWRLAQEFWKHSRQLVPLSHFEALEGFELLVKAGLAEVAENHVYVRGSSQYLEWVHEEREARRLGGKNSAQRPRDDKGRLLSKENQIPQEQTPAETQLTSSCDPAESNSIQVSGSVSGSKKREREETKNDGSEIVQCVDEWGKTLSHHKIKKDPWLDEVDIVRLIQRHGYHKTKFALLGAAFEEKSKDYNPSKHVNIRRLSKPDIFEKFVNLGAQNQPKTREYHEDSGSC